MPAGYGDLKANDRSAQRDVCTGMTLQLSRVSVRHWLPEAVERVARGDINPEDVFTRSVSFAEAAEAVLDRTIKEVLVS